jgi:hypothetical protein
MVIYTSVAVHRYQETEQQISEQDVSRLVRARDGIWFVSFVWIVLRVLDPAIQNRVRIPHSRVDGATVLFFVSSKRKQSRPRNTKNVHRESYTV